MLDHQTRTKLARLRAQHEALNTKIDSQDKPGADMIELRTLKNLRCSVKLQIATLEMSEVATAGA